MNEFDFRNPEEAPKKPGTYRVTLHDVVVRPDGTVFHDVEWIVEINCPAVLWHGPGHQSKTTCLIKSPHDIEGLHETEYMGVLASWRGENGITGFFDESPMEE